MVGTFSKLVTLAGLATTAVSAPSQTKYVFKPELEETYVNEHIPALVDLSQSQYDIATGSSYWSSSFITSTKGKQYLAIAHIMTPLKNVCRSSVLDLQSLQYWVDLTYCTPGENKALDTSGLFNGDFGTYGFAATSSDNVANMSVHVSTNASFAFDISWEATSKVVLNGGSGNIGFGANLSYATEWGIPAAKTTGNLTLDGASVEVDAENSFTWYDRQLSYGAPKNWTWFQFNFPGTEIKASVWSQDWGLSDGKVQNFATVREGQSQYVLAYDLIPDMSKTWVSPNSNLVYPLSWKLEFENGDHLIVDSVLEDQEMYGPDAVVDSAYEGFITASGKFLGQSKGFGVVELVTSY